MAPMIVSGSYDMSVNIWSVLDKQNITKIHNENKGINALAMPKNEQFLIGGTVDKSIIIWEYKTQNLLTKYENAHEELIASAAVTTDSQLIITGSEDKSVRVWKFLKGELLSKLFTFENAQEECMHAIATILNSRSGLTCGKDYSIKFWDFERKTMTYSFDQTNSDATMALAVTEDGKYSLRAQQTDLLPSVIFKKRDFTICSKNTLTPLLL